MNIFGLESWHIRDGTKYVVLIQLNKLNKYYPLSLDLNHELNAVISAYLAETGVLVH
jgi:hypothetical protein